jgi:hypothetical protein
MFDRRLQTRLGVRRPQRIVHEAFSAPSVVLPRVQLPKLGQPANLPITTTVSTPKRCLLCRCRIHVPPGTMFVGQNVPNLLQQSTGDDVVSSSGGRDQVVAHPLFFLAFHQGLGALRLKQQNDRSLLVDVFLDAHLEICMFEHVVRSHPVQDELGLVGHPDDVVLHRVRQQSALVYQFDERQTGVFLQRVLPLLRAQQHHQFHNGVAVLEGGQAFALHQQLLSVRPHQRLRQERREINHDLSEERTHRSQRHLEFLRERRFPRRGGHGDVVDEIVDGEVVGANLSRSLDHVVGNPHHRYLRVVFLAPLGGDVAFDVDDLRVGHVLDVSRVLLGLSVFVQVDICPVLVVVDFVVFDGHLAVRTQVVGLGRVDRVDVLDGVGALDRRKVDYHGSGST